MNTKHTPTPWRHESATKTIRACPSNHWIATVDSWDGAVNNEEDARFIVRACNVHDELLAALDEVMGILDSKSIATGSAGTRARSALAKAKSES